MGTPRYFDRNKKSSRQNSLPKRKQIDGKYNDLIDLDYKAYLALMHSYGRCYQIGYHSISVSHKNIYTFLTKIGLSEEQLLKVSHQLVHKTCSNQILYSKNPYYCRTVWDIIYGLKCWVVDFLIFVKQKV